MSQHRFCNCGARLIFTDNGVAAKYRCPCCSTIYGVEGEGTLLYERTTGEVGDIFNSLLESSAGDVCNKKIMEPCPRCARPIMTMTMIGSDEKPFKTCVCGLIMSIEQGGSSSRKK